MSSGLQLQIRYGLSRSPNDTEIQKWIRVASTYNNQHSKTIEEACKLSAQEVFKHLDIGHYVYNSQPQSLMVLLQELGAMIDKK